MSLGVPWMNEAEAFAWMRRKAPSATTIDVLNASPGDPDRRRVIRLYGAMEKDRQALQDGLGLLLLGDAFRVVRHDG